MFSQGEKKQELLKISFAQKSVFVLLSFLLILIGIVPFIFSPFLSEAANVMLDSLTYITHLTGGR